MLFSKKEEAKDLKPEFVEQLHNELRATTTSTVRLKKPISASTPKVPNSLNSLVSKRRTYDKSETILTKSKRIPLKL